MMQPLKKTVLLIGTLFASHTLFAITPHSIPGGLAVVDIGHFASEPDATFNSKRVLLTRDTPDSPWQAWVGIPQSQTPGPTSLIVNGRIHAFNVEPFSYPEQHLKVSKHYVSPSAKELQRIRQENIQMGVVYRSFTDLPTPTAGMIWPIRGPQSSAFGLRRFFNGEERAPHSGVDIAAPTGTPIHAPAAGKVVLTGDFFFNGKAVFIDHGQGLISMLCHMNDIDVEEGTVLKAGDLIGKVGATGRATGPHLHWTVSLNNARIEPRLLLADDQPIQPNE